MVYPRHWCIVAAHRPGILLAPHKPADPAQPNTRPAQGVGPSQDSDFSGRSNLAAVSPGGHPRVLHRSTYCAAHGTEREDRLGEQCLTLPGVRVEVSSNGRRWRAVVEGTRPGHSCHRTLCEDRSTVRLAPPESGWTFPVYDADGRNLCRGSQRLGRRSSFRQHGTSQLLEWHNHDRSLMTRGSAAVRLSYDAWCA